MKIVVLDGYTENPGDLSWEGLEQLGELTVYDRTSLTDEQETIDRIGDAEIVFTNKTPISRAVLDAYYIAGQRMTDIAESMAYSRQHVYKLRRAGVEKMRQMRQSDMVV